MTGIESDSAESVDYNKLDSLISYSFILDGITAKYSLDIFLLIGKTDDVDFFIPPFYVFSDRFDILHMIVRLIFKIF
jgi:hypothetical protein